MTSRSRLRQQGFTLIELSIVLVIIGLIVGAILVGQDLIKAAQIRSTITQLNNYNAAANTFRNKYNGLPGDLASPTNYFPNIVGMTGGVGLGDGNGAIEPSAVADLNGETVAFWYELNQANEVGEAVGTATPATAANFAGVTPPVIPPAKLGRGSIDINSPFVNTTAGYGLNYFIMGVFSGSTTAPVVSAGLTPLEAFNIDTKLDDGVPSTGTVISIGTGATNYETPATYTVNGAHPPTAGDCVDTTGPIYATDVTAAANTVGCVLGIRSTF